MKRGKLIVIEGTDFSGKQTQAELLYERFSKENIPIAKIRFPKYEKPTGRIIGQCLLGKKRTGYYGDTNWFTEPTKVHPKIASLYYAADRKDSSQEINNYLEQGTHVLLDRYYQSNMGHQGGKITNKEKRNEMFEWLHKLEIEMLKIPKEDFVIFLHMPFEIANELKKSRKEAQDLVEADKEYLKNAEESYLQLAEKYKWITIKCAPNKTLQSLKTPSQIHEEIYSKVKNLLENTNTTILK